MDAQLVREFNDRGLVRLLESPVNFGNFVRLLPKTVAERLDVSRLELKNRVFIAPNLSKTETDVLYSVPCRMKENEPSSDETVDSVLIYLLSELYTRPDNRVGKKIYNRRGQIWDQEERTWQELDPPRPDFRLHLVISIVLYVGDEPWNSSLELDDLVMVPQGMGGYLPKWQTILIPLKEVPPELLLHEGTGVALALLTLRTALFEPDLLPSRLQEVSEAMAQLLSESEWRDTTEYVIAAILNKCKADVQPGLFQIVKAAVDERSRQEEVNAMIVTGADVLREEGRQLGKKEGKEEAISEYNKSLHDLLMSEIENTFGVEDTRAAVAGKTYNAGQTIEIIRRLRYAKKIEDLGL